MSEHERAGAEDGDDGDVELDRYLRRRSIISVIRFAVVGAVVTGVAIGSLCYGRALAAEQAHSAVQFALPSMMQFAAVAGLFVGGVLLVIAAGLAWRLRRSASRLPIARLRR